MASQSPKDCPICHEEYDEEEWCPRVLPCSHTLCTKCIENLISRNSKTCPFCVRKFTARAPRDVGVNGSLLDVLKLLRETEQAVPSPYVGKVGNHSNRVNYLKGETDEVINKLLDSVQEADEEVDKNLQSNNELENSLIHTNKIISELHTQNVNKIQYLKEHSRRLESHKLSIKKTRNVVKKAKTKLASSWTFIQIAETADEVENVKKDVEHLRCLMKHVAEDGKTRLKLEKVVDLTRDPIDKLEKIVRSSGMVDEVSFTPDIKHMKIQDVNPQKIRHVIPQVTIETLRSKSASVMRLIRQGQIFATQELEEKKRYAHITLDERNRILLHCLREQTVLSNAHLLKHSDILKLMNVSWRLVFLTLSTKNTLGKLYIRLFPNSKRAEQFALLCSGEKGVSYVQSNLLKVFCKGTNDEYVWGGDYENLGGKGGKALVPDAWKEEGGVFRQPQIAGLILGRSSGGGESQASQFCIFIKDNPRMELDWCFGMIEEGLSFLQEAIASCSDITKVVVSDAGMVLPI